MSDIHISYARPFRQYATQIYDYLSRAGFDVWLDSASMHGGENWVAEWHNSLREARVLVLVLSTLSSLQEENDKESYYRPGSEEYLFGFVYRPYLIREWSYFLVEGKPIVPFIITDKADTEVNLPEPLQQYLYIKTAQDQLEDGLRQLAVALRNLLIKASPKPYEVSLEILGIDVLTPEILSESILPFIMALGELQQLLNQAAGQQKYSSVQIRQITQNSPVLADILGIKGVIDGLLEVILPWRRQAKQLELKEKEALIEKQRLENEMTREDIISKRIDNQVKFQNLNQEPVLLRLNPDSPQTVTEEETLSLIIELVKSINASLSSPDLARYLVAMRTPLKQILESNIQFLDDQSLLLRSKPEQHDQSQALPASTKDSQTKQSGTKKHNKADG